MRKLFALVVLIGVTASANETSHRSLQSGSPSGPTSLHDRGIRGEGQILSVLDSGVEFRACDFAEADGTPPPMNTGTPLGGLEWRNVDPTRRKIIAYNFLYSCDQYPNRAGCDRYPNASSLDNHGHGTHAASAALGDRGAFGVHDYGDSIAPAAKLVVQDAGLTTGDACTQYPGIGCPAKLTPIFEQAYKQGVRIHSNSWGDRQGVPPPLPPPTANYSETSRQVDAFVWSHPDSLMVFNTGNYSGTGEAPAHSLSSPGSAKNTLQIGGTRVHGGDDDILAAYTLHGPTRDGRIKPDLVGPSLVGSGDIDLNGDKQYCDMSTASGTSWAAPTIAGAAALVRQYYMDGFHPNGVPSDAHRMTPSAALLKATMIASARQVPYKRVGSRTFPALPVPSAEQGWGFPVLDDALYFPGDPRALRVSDVPLETGLTQGQSAMMRVNARGPLKVVLVWTDPPGTPRSVADTTPQLVNDLDLRVRIGGSTNFGNGATPDRLNNVEVVSLDNASGLVEISVTANSLGFGPRQSYALVILGDFTDGEKATTRVRAVRR